MTLHDDDPIIVARMLLYLYTSDYEPDKSDMSLLLNMMENAASKPSRMQHEEVPEIVLAAQMYGIAEKYGITDLKELSARRFLATVETTSMANLLILVHIIYESTLETDKLLRKWVVWRIQKTKMSKGDSSKVVALVFQHNDFANDLISKYAARNYVWCPDCQAYINLQQCSCGWSGMCGENECTNGSPDGNLGSLVCTACGSSGRLQLDQA